MQRADYEQAVEAARRWIAEHGRYPQQQERALGAWAPDHAHDQAALGWEALMRAAAGAGARSPKLEPRRRRRLELLITLCRAHEELGRWPEAWEWEHRTKAHVTRRTYVRWFGSWEAACRAAARLRV